MARDILQQIQLFNSTREPQVLKFKYQAMTENAFRFYRGTCHLFYYDIKHTFPFQDSPKAWICGDLHVENYGSFKGANRLVYFDISDFDEATLAPILWDILRLATSIELAGTEIGLGAKEKRKLIQTLLDEYTLQLITQKAVAVEKETAKGLVKKLFNKVALRNTMDILHNRTHDELLILNPQLLSIPKTDKKELIKSFDSWFKKNFSKEYVITDAGFRIAGTGSIGVKRYLCLAKHKKDDHKNLLIDIKQAMPTSVSTSKKTTHSIWLNEAERVIKTQELVQHVAPAFLSAFAYKKQWYVVKELQPSADKVSLEDIKNKPANLNDYIKSLARITASAHLRSSGRRGAASADKLKNFIENKTWMKGTVDWAAAYAKQVKKDYLYFCKSSSQKKLIFKK